MKVKWSPLALAHLDGIVRYIAQDNVAAALKLQKTISRQVAHLASHPNRGRPGRVEGTRELVIPRTPYLVIYRVRKAEVTFARVLHGAQRWPPKQPEP